MTQDRPWEQRFRGIRVVEMLRARNVTPLLRRVTLGGAETADMPAGPNLKLLIPPPGLNRVEWPAATKPLVWPEKALQPAVRTYTVRRQDPASGEIDVDFVLHGEGPAAHWAATARPGDAIGISVPGGRDIPKAGWVCIAGDHCAAPAITTMLARLPRETCGHAVIEVPGPEEELPVDAPPGVEVRWIHASLGRPGLVAAVRAVPWPAHDDIAFWVGAESETARTLRSYARDERKLHRRRFLVIGYWKRGMSETAYGEIYDHDRDEDYFAVAREEEDARGPHRHRHEDEHAR